MVRHKICDSYVRTFFVLRTGLPCMSNRLYLTHFIYHIPWYYSRYLFVFHPLHLSLPSPPSNVQICPISSFVPPAHTTAPHLLERVMESDRIRLVHPCFHPRSSGPSSITSLYPLSTPVKPGICSTIVSSTVFT